MVNISIAISDHGSVVPLSPAFALSSVAATAAGKRHAVAASERLLSVTSEDRAIADSDRS
jgi:hypothetical protein